MYKMSESIQYYRIEWRQRQLIEWVHGFGGPVTLPHKWSGLPSLSVTTLMTQLLYLEQVNMYLNIWEPFTHTFVNIGTRCAGTYSQPLKTTLKYSSDCKWKNVFPRL